MRVLVAHNRYRSDAPSGENDLVDAEIALLRDGGIDVVPFIKDSDSIAASRRVKGEATVGPVYAPSGVREFRRLLNRERPDVVHVHNVFPLISPWVVRTAHSFHIPVVQTVHNYRHSCVNGLHYRDGHTCTDCVGRRIASPAVVHGCYRGSRAQSLPMVASQAMHKRTWRSVDTFIALTDFMRDRLVDAGAPPESIVIRPTWVPDHGDVTPVKDAGSFLFVGRLDVNKGIELLLDAWAEAGRPGTLRIIGNGPLAAVVRDRASLDDSINYEGPASPADIVKAMDAAGAIVVPSTWFEGYPLVVAEAFGRGRPVIATTGGSVATTMDDTIGWLVEPQITDLARILRSIPPASIAERGAAARQRYELNNSPKSALSSICAIYQSVAR